MTELPKGWEYPTIEDILQPLPDGRLIHQGWSPQCERTPITGDDEWGVLKTTAIQAGAFLPNEHKRLPDALEPRAAIEVQQGDLLLTCAGPRARCGVACLVRNSRPHLMLSGKMYRFRVDERLIDPRFIEAMLCSPDLQMALDSIKTGGSDSGLNLTHERFRSLRLPLPPTAEQERIVTTIEEAFSKLDAGEAGLRAVRQLLKRMREAVLAAAVTGRLVPQDPTDTPATKLLADAGADEVAGASLPLPPETWVATTVGAISTMSLGKMLDAKAQTGKNPQPYLRNINVRWFSFDLDDLAIMDIRPEEFDRVAVADGDLVVCEGGQPGRCAVWRRAPMVIQKALHRVRPKRGVSSDYLSLVVCWWGSRSEYERFITGTTIKHIPKEKLKLLPVPLPPPEEQLRIVAEVERQFSFIDAGERAVDAGLARSAALRRSVLGAAFQGRLCPQDPSDEPASVLLERIRAERAASDGLASGRRRKKVEAP